MFSSHRLWMSLSSLIMLINPLRALGCPVLEPDLRVEFSSESESELGSLIGGAVGSVYRSIEEGTADELLSPLESFQGIPLSDYEAAHVYQAEGHLWSERFELDAAIAAFEQSLALGVLSPRDTRNLEYNLGKLYGWTGRSEQGLDATLRWFDGSENPSNSDFSEVIGALYLADRPEEALAWTELAEVSGAGDLELGIGKAFLQLQLGRIGDFERGFRELVVRTPERAQDLLWVLDDSGQSLDDATRIRLMEFADSADLLDGYWKTELANLYLRLGMPYRAAVLMERGLYDRAIEASAARWQLLAESWLAASDPVRAAEPLARAADLSGEPKLHERLGRLLLDLRRWKSAEDPLRKALAGGLGEARLLLFAALFVQGRFDDAREILAPPKPPSATPDPPDGGTGPTPPSPERALPCLGVELTEEEEPSEARLAEVQERSPAGDAGLLAGDAIVQFGARQIGSGADLLAEIRAARPGEGFSVIVRRAGAHVPLSGVVGGRAEDDLTCEASLP